jgi:hypothetical protein
MGSLLPDLLPVPSAEGVRTDAGRILIWHPARAVFVTRAEGRVSEAAAHAMYVACRRIVASDGSLVVFNDWEEVTGYDTAARILLTRVGLAFRHSVEVSHFFVRARILTLGIHIANAVLGNLQAHPDRRAFESLLRSTILDRQSSGAVASS